MSPDEAARTVSALFESWYSSLVRYASRAISDIALAEDLVQETFMQLYRELRRGGAVEKPKAWTLCVLRREIGKHIRSQARTGERHEALDVLDNPPANYFFRKETRLEHGLELDELTRLFSVLTRREEEVLLLRMEALKYRQIAAHLGISAKSVSTHLVRALRKLQKAAKAKAEKGSEVGNVAKTRPETLQ